MKKLYLDIDGVLIKKDGTPAEGLVKFLQFATKHFDCYWLTTHCDGDAEPVFLYLVGKVSPEALPYIEKIKPTRFGARKTDAIDFMSEFYWLDHTVFESEQKVLVEKGAEERFILVDLRSNPQALESILEILKTLE